jgi:hypothetical protein
MKYASESYAGDEEVAAIEKLRQTQHDELEVFEAEKAGATGQAYPDDPFYGNDAADVKTRRHARGAYAREDYEEPVVDPIDSYTGPRTGAEVGSDAELNAYAHYRESLAREKYPDYEEVINRYVAPRLKEEGVNPQELLQWILRDDDFAEKAYRVGLAEKKRLRSKLPSAEEVRNMSADEFESLLAASRNEPGAEEEEESEEFVSRREMKRMNRITNPVDFAKALDAMKWRG